ncbi:DUF2125 domain-containing protein [Anianabacter salinae]|uniref:DUF2125 domain-containing protein n=1 Tax=Anianabacter salinae TaxID=2851023 RepID=UPI00225E65BD|nr:DUF2125 domain-containing protein [Anianabacter salinae]MBV0913652.1 DUF2125 domain-containing protein [Anianabacter salinae]
MTYRLFLCATTALAGLSAPAAADVSAQDVWTSWQELSASVGQTVAAETEDMSGATLTVSGVTITQDTDDMTLDGAIDEVTFTENGDGTVSIEMSPSYTMQTTTTVDGETLETSIAIEQSNMMMLASGDPGSIDYAITADAITASIVPPNEEDGLTDGLIEFGLTDVDAGYSTVAGDLTELAGEITAGGALLSVTGTDDGSEFALTGAAADINVTSAAVLPQIESDDMAAMIDAGFVTETLVTHGEASYDIAATGDEAFQLAGAAASGRFELAISQDGLVYDVSNTAVSMTVSGDEIPFPEVTANLEEIGIGISIPVTETAEPEPFSALVNLSGLTISDMIWGVFDPAGQLPRDPATLLIEVSGQARWLQNIFDTEAMDEAEVPGELSALNLDTLTLSLAGAELTGTGGFTFDNSDTETFDGMPAPDGQVDLQLVGGVALLDTLVAMGFVPQEQAMAARMFMGLFAQPGEGEDTLVSTIEVQPDGSIFANGQQLQ